MRAQVVGLVTGVVEKSLESKKKSDHKRLDNLLLDQIREEAILDIERLATSSEYQRAQKLHEKFQRTLDLKLQLDKLERRFIMNMPPPSLNVFDKLELHAKGLKSDTTQLCSLREQWKNVLRKTKLDLTALMRQAKVVEIDEATRKYAELQKELSEQLRKSYSNLCHVTQVRHEEFARKKLNFLAKRASITNEN
jgi:hypothetical protein